MPVFIAHRTQDDGIAQRIYTRLSGNWGITCFLDNFDPYRKYTASITKTILDAVDKSTHLLVVISHSTRESWWVPYEIGAAQRGSQRITSYRSAGVELPDYLSEWPIIETDEQIDLFAQAYELDVYGTSLRRRTLLSEIDCTVQRMKADTFHRNLKQMLNQL